MDQLEGGVDGGKKGGLDAAFQAPQVDGEERRPTARTRRKADGRSYVKRRQRQNRHSGWYIATTIGCYFWGVTGVGLLGWAAMIGLSRPRGDGHWWIALIPAAVAIFILVTCVGVLLRRRWAMIPSYICSLLMLPFIPLGTVSAVLVFLGVRKTATLFR